ncbi:unnamed protein product [Staurois parvus]|uniref:Uncharacterized protein n=1 Tax=Staurois parvus TaxID=386267 RepID=A0ABN9AWP2_9NEOB|nr:unnamed protein product [Staurois parvus]
MSQENDRSLAPLYLSLENLAVLFSQVVTLQTLPTLSCSHWVVVNVWELCIPF